MSKNAVADVGLIGLAVMGKNLALNMADHGFKVAVFNRTAKVTSEFVAAHSDTPGGLVGCETLGRLLAALSRPRKIVVLVKAGSPVDDVLRRLVEAGIDKEDLVIDCGNSQWTDTIRREKEYSGRCRFFGSGVSGGELGARFGPSLMPGGDAGAWKHLEAIWKAIAAKVDPKTGKPIETARPGQPVKEGIPCTAYIGENGAGHYVKMIHNGIEYIDMQLISEAYFLMRKLAPAEPDELADIFTRWNEGDLDSYLIQVTADILRQRDPQNPHVFIIDRILDTAQQKGTGKWTSINALDQGVPANSIAEAVFARYMSALKEERLQAAQQLTGQDFRYGGRRDDLIEAVREALYCSKICAYAQGFQLMRSAEVEYGWKLDLGAIAGIWRGGCIIRARFLQKITDAYVRDSKLVNLLLDPYFSEQIRNGQTRWRSVVALAAGAGIAAPAFMSALAYYDSYRCAQLPANLLQAQRDYFGAHTYERTDEPRGVFFHLDWSAPERTETRVQAG
jgi:6-phosphogluconate dehydrogenase